LLLDLTANSAIGFAAVLRLSFFRRVIGEVVKWVRAYRPKAICLVDSSGLNLRIARALFTAGLTAKAGGATKALYFISPQIWASRARRRFAMAAHLDGLATIFPFEADCYKDTNLPVTFVGHPFVAADHVSPVRYDPQGPVLLLPGSRSGAVARIFPILNDAYLWYRNDGGTRGALVLHPGGKILDTLRDAKPPPDVQLSSVAQTGEPVGAAAVLTSSGTMSLECALAGIPGAIVYRTDPFTYAIGRMIVRVPHLGIANILLGEQVYPEYIQGNATPARLAAQLSALLRDPQWAPQAQSRAEDLRKLLAQPADSGAGDWLASHLC
jgi:lipid-A-disaccharide synthase